QTAGIVGAAIFSTMPITLWISSHTYPDLLAVLFLCAALVCLLSWQANGYTSLLVLAGVLAGFCVVTKQIAALYLVAMLAALALTARPNAAARGRLLTLLVFGMATTVTVAPWFLRSLLVYGSFPLLGTIMRQASEAPGLRDLAVHTPVLTVGDLATVNAVETRTGGVDNSWLGILTSPWQLTFEGAPQHLQVVRHGEFGIALLMMLPLVLLTLCSRGALLVGLTAAISTFGWTFTIQAPRHVLPSFALASVLAGVAGAQVVASPQGSPEAQLGRVVRVGLIGALGLTPLFFLPNLATSFPVSVLVGSESPEHYLARIDPAYTALTAATDRLPPDTRVGYFGQWQGAQAQTEARLFYFGQYAPDPSVSLDTQSGATSEALFQWFDGWDLRYFIWDRPDTRPQDIDTLLLSGDFLLTHTTILDGADGVYLFEFHPEGVPDPRDQPNLLSDPTFSTLGGKSSPWTGRKRDLSPEGFLEPRRQMETLQQASVTPEASYIVTVTGRCTSTLDRVGIAMGWQRADGSIISATTDTVALGTKVNTAFVWAVAPAYATAVEIGFTTASGTPCQIAEAGLFALHDTV
ncbi:MAG: glycosyltransferase family 39 protein, partial [Thermomicrobiales bacterium]|nr:glycosyltransferase family 39 protein [Thermomicrobiales bacterium]